MQQVRIDHEVADDRVLGQTGEPRVGHQGHARIVALGGVDEHVGDGQALPHVPGAPREVATDRRDLHPGQMRQALCALEVPVLRRRLDSVLADRAGAEHGHPDGRPRGPRELRPLALQDVERGLEPVPRDVAFVDHEPMPDVVGEQVERDRIEAELHEPRDAARPGREVQHRHEHRASPHQVQPVLGRTQHQHHILREGILVRSERHVRTHPQVVRVGVAHARPDGALDDDADSEVGDRRDQVGQEVAMLTRFLVHTGQAEARHRHARHRHTSHLPSSAWATARSHGSSLSTSSRSVGTRSATPSTGSICRPYTRMQSTGSMPGHA